MDSIQLPARGSSHSPPASIRCFFMVPTVAALYERRPAVIDRRYSYLRCCGVMHAKLAALLGSPDPLYCATRGYTHKGRVIFVPAPISCSGATSFSTQRSSAEK